MNSSIGKILGLALILIAHPIFLASQTSDARWSLTSGVSAQRYNASGEQLLLGLTPWFPSAKFGMSRYLRPGFDFRTEVFLAQAVPDPVSTQGTSSALFAFQHVLAIKLNNDIFQRQDARVSPYALVGVGGSFHAQRPDAFSPFGLGLRVRTSPNGEARAEAVRQVSWNRSPQTWNLSLSYAITLPSRPVEGSSNAEGVHEVEEVIGSILPPDSDGDGVPDSLDLCPYLPGLIQNNGCPEEEDAEQDGNPETWLVEEETKEEVEEDFPVLEEEDIAEVVDNEEIEDSYNWEFSEPEAQDEPVASNTRKVESLFPPTIEDSGISKDSSGLAQAANPANDQGVTPCQATPFPSITFQAGSSELSPADLRALDELAEAMIECPELVLILEGKADDAGSEDDNLVLSIRRAYNAKYHMVYQHGISQRRIVSKGGGSKGSKGAAKSIQFKWSS